MAMKSYKNLSGKSGVVFFEPGGDYIDVQFTGGAIYRYSYRKPGVEKVEEMKKLAEIGLGLGSYISRHVKKDYEYKL